MEAQENNGAQIRRTRFMKWCSFKKEDDECDETRDDTDESDESDDSSIQQTQVNYNCIAKSVLAGIVIVTAIFMVVIAASNRKISQQLLSSSTPEGANSHPENVLKHQFLIRGHLPIEFSQILAVAEQSSSYVIELDPIHNKHYVMYLVVNFQEKMETLLILSKSNNHHGTNIEETVVLYCEKFQFPRKFSGTFATVQDLTKILNIKKRTDNFTSELENTYVGAPFQLGKFVSQIFNGSCEMLEQKDIFSWNKIDETHACGKRLVVKNESGTCSQDTCQPFPGIPLSKGLACNKFRLCNYMMMICDPYIPHKPRLIQSRPYCVCRRTAAMDAHRLQCPLPEDDGGECEIPRRDLLLMQSTLPCLCLYKVKVLYPFITQEAYSSMRSGETGENSQVEWIFREDVISAPAMKFSECLC